MEPWAIATGGIGNGGLSLRRRSAMLFIIKNLDYREKYIDNEDIFFSLGCQRFSLPRPSYEISKKFSVETVFYDDPIGLHKPHFTEDECKHMFVINNKE
jgi:hypothetical protein